MYANLISRLRNDDLVQEEFGNQVTIKEDGTAAFQDLTVKNLTVTNSSNIQGSSNINLSSLTANTIPLVNNSLLVDSSIIEGTSVIISKPVSTGANNISTTGVLSANTVQATGVIADSATIADISGTNISGTLTSPNQSNVRGLGSLLGLTMDGDIDMNSNDITNIGSLGTLAEISILGAATVGSLSATTNVSATNLTGQLQTSSQPHINSIGVLQGLEMGNNINMASNDIINVNDLTASGVVTGGSLTDGTATLSSGALTGVTNITASGTVTSGGLNISSGLLESDIANSCIKIVHDGGASSITQLNSIDNASLYIRRIEDSPGYHDYGGVLAFGDNSGSQHLAAAIAVCQTGSSGDDDECGLTFHCHPSSSSNSTLVEFLRLSHTGQLSLGTKVPHASAEFEIDSSIRGFLPPRMSTSERDSISSASEGLLLFNSTTKKMNYFDGTLWVEM